MLNWGHKSKSTTLLNHTLILFSKGGTFAFMTSLKSLNKEISREGKNHDLYFFYIIQKIYGQNSWFTLNNIYSL